MGGVHFEMCVVQFTTRKEESSPQCLARPWSDWLRPELLLRSRASTHICALSTNSDGSPSAKRTQTLQYSQMKSNQGGQPAKEPSSKRIVHTEGLDRETLKISRLVLSIGGQAQIVLHSDTWKLSDSNRGEMLPSLPAAIQAPRSPALNKQYRSLHVVPSTT
jgi:hypothetical protein